MSELIDFEVIKLKQPDLTINPEFTQIATNLYQQISETRTKLGFSPYSCDDKIIFLNQAYQEYLIHSHNIRKDGSKYFPSHLIGTCEILINYLGITGVSSMIAALSHDDIEDANKLNIKIETDRDLFNPVLYEKEIQNPDKLNRYIQETWKMVNGVSKIKEDTRKKTLEKSFIKLLENIKSYDIRAAYIKLADRLHNIITLDGHKNPEKQKQIALETIDLYIPLAELLKVSEFKRKILNESLKYVNPKLLTDFDHLISLKKQDLAIREFLIIEKLINNKNDKNDKNLLAEENIEFTFTNLADIWMDRNLNIDIDQLNLYRDFNIAEIDKFYTIKILVNSELELNSTVNNLYNTFNDDSNFTFQKTILPFNKGISVQLFNNDFKKLDIRINTKDHEIQSKRGYLAYNDNKPIDGLKSAVEAIIARGKKTGDIIKEIREGLFPKMIIFDQNNNPVEMPKRSNVLDYLVRKEYSFEELNNMQVLIAPQILGKFKLANLYDEIPPQACVYIELTNINESIVLPSPAYNYLCQSENYSKIKTMFLQKEHTEKIEIGKLFLQQIATLYNIPSEDILQLLIENTNYDENDDYCHSENCVYEAIAVNKINLLKMILQLPSLQKDTWTIKCILVDKPQMLHELTAKLGLGINIIDINIAKSKKESCSDVYMKLKLTDNMSKYDFLKTLLKLYMSGVDIQMER